MKKIREESDVPIFFITARVLEEDELHGYALGADDYITKPFSLPALYVKAVSLMKRIHGNESFRKIKIESSQENKYSRDFGDMISMETSGLWILISKSYEKPLGRVNVRL